MQNSTEAVRGRQQGGGLINPRWFPRWLKPVVHAACLLPLVWVVLAAWQDRLGANPIEAITRFLGDWALRGLLVALLVTPLRRFSGWTAVMRLRRPLGLWAFAYALLHLLSYVVLDQYFDWAVIWGDILKRTYITLGMASAVILLVLAVTSIPALIRRLGGRRWVFLHKSVYLASVLGILHYFWMVKADTSSPWLYAVCLMFLLVLRLPFPHRRNPALKS
ncbi:protein-methionine-sulfoxide reductase heme-binding subunit MsrQ [Insolitispirillum peregrinum]|uniref:sulfite oxidase heme-binding subunit YedZ n=1 Tax=Insolitispirillum peregrinum TaxID=80876 RepID=UPI001FE63066|nr:protein-methionine-sulfoxide reductase heme-binding subunit MsrQ [Insolitispirillum peregrinum]